MRSRDSIAQLGTDGLTESCVLHNSAGELLAVLQQPTEDHEWVAHFPAGRPAMGASASTTSTTTEMLNGPPRLLGYEQAATQAGCVVPHVLTDARVWPPLVLTPPGVSVPVEQLHLLPGFSRIGSDGVTVPYSLLVQGYPPVTLFGSRHWTMADFCGTRWYNLIAGRHIFISSLCHCPVWTRHRCLLLNQARLTLARCYP